MKLLKNLKKINSRLTFTKVLKNFTKKLDDWHKKYKIFLGEITVNSFTIHPRIISAYRSLRANLPIYLPTKTINIYQFLIQPTHLKV